MIRGLDPTLFAAIFLLSTFIAATVVGLAGFAFGLKRRGFSSQRIMAIKRAFKTIYKSGLSLAEARSQLTAAADGEAAADLRLMLEFIERSERALLR